MQRILYVITQGTWGGAQRNVLELVKHFSKNNEVFVAIGESGGRRDLQEELHNLKAQTIELKFLKRNVSPLNDLMAIIELKKTYKRISPDIIHLHSSKAGVLGTAAGALISTEKRPKIIYTAHGWVFGEKINFLSKAIYTLAEGWASAFRDKIIVLGESEKNKAIQIGVPENKLVIIRNGVDINQEFFTKEKSRRLIIDISEMQKNSFDNFWIGCVGTFIPNKGIDILIEAYSKLPDYVKEKSNLVCIGGGKQKKLFQEKIKKLKLNQKIILVDFIAHAQKIIKAFDLLIIPSIKEGMPYVLLDAFAGMVPVIATRVGVIEEVAADGVNLELCNPAHPESLMTTIKKLYDNPHYALGLARGGTEAVKKLSLQNFYNGIETVYKSL